MHATALILKANEAVEETAAVERPHASGADLESAAAHCRLYFVQTKAIRILERRQKHLGVEN